MQQVKFRHRWDKQELGENIANVTWNYFNPSIETRPNNLRLLCDVVNQFDVSSEDKWLVAADWIQEQDEELAGEVRAFILDGKPLKCECEKPHEMCVLYSIWRATL